MLPQPEVVIGASTSVWAQPFGTHYHDSRTQVIYLKDELGGPGNLSGLSLFVATTPPQTLSNWTIRLKHTPLTQYLKPAWEGSGWTTVYQNQETIFATGWVTFLFSALFAYDGANNLMVDLSFNNSSFTSDEGQVRYHSASADRTAWFQTDSAFGDPLSWSGTSARRRRCSPGRAPSTGWCERITPKPRTSRTSGRKRRTPMKPRSPSRAERAPRSTRRK